MTTFHYMQSIHSSSDEDKDILSCLKGYMLMCLLSFPPLSPWVDSFWEDFKVLTDMARFRRLTHHLTCP